MSASVLVRPIDTEVLRPPTWQAVAPQPQTDADRYICPITGLRFYLIPDGGGGKLAVPGVTSILGDDSSPEDKERLESWRLREIAAGRDPDEGRNRGSAVHAVLEKAVRGEISLGADYCELPNEARTQVLDFASGMDRHLRRFDRFLWNERPLVNGWNHCWSPPAAGRKPLARVWSRTWGFAGTPDLIGVVRRLTVLSDFKTSNKPYYRSPGRRVPQHHKLGYLKYVKTVRQLCAYRLAIRETLGLEIDRLQIIVGLPEPGRAQMFWVPRVEMERETENFRRACVRFWRRQAERISGHRADQELSPAARGPAALPLAA